MSSMDIGASFPSREHTPSYTPPISSVPQKRPLEEEREREREKDVHSPAVNSQLNPDFKGTTTSTSTSTTTTNAHPTKPKSEPQDDTAAATPASTSTGITPFARDRAPRQKKESLKKRESNVQHALPGNSSTASGTGGAGGGRATPDPKASVVKKAARERELGREKVVMTPQRFKLPPPKMSDFEAPREPVFVVWKERGGVRFCETSDHVLNKKLFHYTQCVADPAFQRSNYYRRTDPVPFGPGISLEDTSTHMFFDESMHHVTTDKGWRMAKGNVCVRHGRYYWECKITSGIPRRKKSEVEQSTGHVRMGWARREATLDAPVGFDAYSYALRDVSGQKVFLSRPQNFFPPGEDIKEGDVIGLEIALPSMELHRKVVEGHYNPAVDLADDEKPGLEAADIIRDRVPIRFKTHTYFEQVEYHSSKELEELMNPSPIISSAGGLSGPPQEPGPTHPQPALRTLPHSSITVYKNGKLMGTPFKDLLAFLPPASKPHIDKTQVQIGAREGLDDGMLGYYPAISVFRGGAAEVNFGPKFWFPPPGYEGSKGAGQEEEEADEVDMIGGGHYAEQQKREGGAASGSAGGNGKLTGKVKAVGERFDEQVVEDIVWDVVDEVDFWVQDGMPEGVVGGKAALGVNVLAVGEEGIKELVQDDE